MPLVIWAPEHARCTKVTEAWGASAAARLAAAIAGPAFDDRWQASASPGEPHGADVPGNGGAPSPDAYESPSETIRKSRTRICMVFEIEDNPTVAVSVTLYAPWSG